MAAFDNPAFEEDVVFDEDGESIDDERHGVPAEGSADAVVSPVPAHTDAAGSAVASLQQELIQTSVDDYYNSLAQRGLAPALGRDYSKFEWTTAGKLRLKASPNINLTNVQTGEPLAFATVASTRGGSYAIRNELGFVDWRSRRKLPAKAVSALQDASVRLGDSAADVEHVELQDLGRVASDVVQTMETSLTDAEIDEVLGTMDDPPLNIREIRGLDKALQRVRGELVNNLAKLSELDAHIQREKIKLAEAEDEEQIRRIENRLRDLYIERDGRLEALSANREALRSQINRMRETIRRILHEDTTLADRIRTLFREQGVTIASILTAIGMSISTLVLALTGGSGSAPAPAPSPTPPPPDKGGLKEWVKNQLKALSRVLAKLAGKAAAALPGIIGAIVGSLIRLLGRAVGWLAEHVWALAVAIGGLLLVGARDFLETAKRP